MALQSDLKAEWGELFGALSTAFASGDRTAFIQTLDRLGEAREHALYRDLRELSGDLRLALEQFRLDSRLATLAGKDVPDARLRLDHALKLTEEGAHRTLDLVERSCPLAERIAKQAAALTGPLRSVREGLLDGTTHPASVAEVLAQAAEFLTVAQRESDLVRGNLTEVLMAQSSQDLSGQIIRGVIVLVGEVERTLAHLSTLAGNDPASSVAPQSPAASSGNGFGPAIPGLTTGAVGEQNDVDALLADLGM
ncbi:MAG TPA: protein phosphatase CheZ [Steroidobacteraceae bacterium]